MNAITTFFIFAAVIFALLTIPTGCESRKTDYLNDCGMNVSGTLCGDTTPCESYTLYAFAKWIIVSLMVGFIAMICFMIALVLTELATSNKSCVKEER